MDKNALRARRATLIAALHRFEHGEMTHYEEGIEGELARDATHDHIAKLRERIAEIDRTLDAP